MNIQSMGGKARAESLTDTERTESAKKAAAARWNLPRATHEGDLPLLGRTLHCAVLEDGRRLLTQSDFMRALGRARQAKGREYYKGDVNLPAFLTANNLKPFIDSDLYVTSSQVVFKPLKGTKAYGYAAELLPSVCEVFLKARDSGALAANQKHIATEADLLMRALAHVGITALVDEATGYQEVRDRHALEAILNRYLLKELAAWAKRFPDDFYKQIFRLRGWEWKGMKVNRPSCVGRYTNDLIYQRLAPGILEELKARMPRTETGAPRGLLQQLLTPDVGHPALQAQLAGIMALQRAAPDGGWEQFHRMVERAFPKFNVTIPLALPED